MIISTVLEMLQPVLYAKDSYDITKDIIKLLNEKYKSAQKTEEKK